MKRQLGKCCPRAYSDLIRSNIPGSSGVGPSCSPYSRSPPPPTMETSLEGPPVVKPTREELQASVELLAKKRRSAKHKAQASLEVVPEAGSIFPVVAYQGAGIALLSSGEGAGVAFLG